MDEKKLKAIFVQATKIAQTVPQHLQQVAFNRALDILINSQKDEEYVSPDYKRRKKSKHHIKKNKTKDQQQVRKSPIRKQGPKTVLKELAHDGFFKNPKTIGEIQSHLAKKKGLTFKTTEISPALLRLIRDKILDRDENKDGQYEYKSK